MTSRAELATTQRWVIKVGSSLLTNAGQGLDDGLVGQWVAQIAALRHAGVKEIVLVSSGAVAEGMVRLGWSRRPKALHHLQAAAAVGQMGLIQAYESRFKQHGLHTAQILLTHDDLSDRKRYLNARSTLQSLIELGVIPVVNENDTVSVEEIQFGDNDTLAAMVANLLMADVLVILTDQVGMYDKDPRKHTDAKLIHEARAGDSTLEAMASGGGPGDLGRGGMLTKVRAAARAARSGTATLIASGRDQDVLLRLHQGEVLGTFVNPDKAPLVARKQWLATRLQVKGWLHVDAGAVRVLKDSGRSLLPVGVTAVDGEFSRGELVACVGPEGREIARGLVNYSADEARKLVGVPTDKIEALLGYVDEDELIHRDNMVLV